MTPEIIYFIKINIALALFYAFYRLFCCKDTFFQWRRFALLAFLAVSFLYPFFNLQEWVKQQEPIHHLANLYAASILPDIGVSPSGEADKTGQLFTLLQYIYLNGMLVLSVRFIIRLGSIYYYAARCAKKEINGITLRLLKKTESPFSFFHWIFLPEDSLTKEERDEILTHEQTHARQFHSIDILLSEAVCIVCWMNPFAWLLKREIRQNLEYLADHKVLQTGYDCKSYQYHLLGFTNQKAIANLSNNFNVLPIKNRIKMMNKKRTGSLGRAKYIMFIPLAALLMLISNIEAVARISSEITRNVFQELTRKAHQELSKKTYQGIVLDESGKALKGVSVVILNTHDGTTTDAEGKFRIEALPSQSLWFSYVGKASIIYPLEKEKGDGITIRLKTETIEYKTNKASAKPITTEKGIVFEVVEVMPEYPGGMGECLNFLSKNIKYPAQAAKDSIQGRVIAQFVITEDGSVTDPVIVRSVSPELDAEALRVIKMMPNWTPGRQRGVPVNVKYTIPITFKISSKDK